jgi:hypothetical protein
MSTDSEYYQTKYGPAVMLTRKNYDQWKEIFEIILNPADAWGIVNCTEAAPAGNTENAIAARTNFRKHSHTSKASETPRQYEILSKLISTLCAHKFGAPML